MKAHPDGLITLTPAKTNRELQVKLVHNKIELPNLECKKNAIELPEYSLSLTDGWFVATSVPYCICAACLAEKQIANISKPCWYPAVSDMELGKNICR